jgi:MFS family permease
MMVASAVMMVWGGFKRNIIGVFVGIFCGAFGMIIIALTPPGIFWVAALGVVLIGFTLPIANVSSQTIWQKVVPPEKLGRVFSVRTTIAQFTAPFAFLVAGILAELFSIPLIFIVFGSTLVTLLILAWVLSDLPRVEKHLEKDDLEYTKNQSSSEENQVIESE